jgi:hypothetical protein
MQCSNCSEISVQCDYKMYGSIGLLLNIVLLMYRYLFDISVLMG